MNRNNIVLWSILIVLLAAADRITKFFALNMLGTIKINEFLSLEFMLNRGISWGMFHNGGTTVFTIISCIIIIVTAILIGIAYWRHQAGNIIVGELLVICGAISNIIDRMVYSGVVDFMAFGFHDFMFPVFNFADVYIVVGVMIMFVCYAVYE